MENEDLEHNSEVPNNQSDDDFEKWIFNELRQNSPQLYQEYPNVFQRLAICVTKWRKRYHGNKPLWNRIFKKDRVVKETIESIPIINAVDHWMSSHENVTIMDLCSGKGYLSMLLSEYLEESNRVKKLLLIDKQWSLHNMVPMAHHISWEHIYGDTTKEDSPNYFDTWPIPLVTSKQDLKQSRTLRQMKARFQGEYPIIILAIHLCGTLSTQAIKLFHSLPEAQMLILKPCCLPDIFYAKRQASFEVGNYSFPTKEVCSRGKWTTKKKGRWQGPPRWHLESKFHKWCFHLHEGLRSEGDLRTKLSEIHVQSKGGFQNTFLFAEKQPTSSSMWDVVSRHLDKEGVGSEDRCATTQDGGGDDGS